MQRGVFYTPRPVVSDIVRSVDELLRTEFGLEDGQTEAVASNSVWKARLKEVNDAAIAAGVFGVPFFVVDGEPFWGNDRRAQIERWLEKGPF
jgi:2-hydroxychromene-2-carboxylate isomerase